MPSWREMAAQAVEPPTPIVDRYGLDAELYGHLARLNQLTPPAKIEKAANWRPIVEDALRLAREGWAAHALALGWSVSDLYGIGPVDSWEFEGLAVWINGRAIRMLDEGRAVAVEPETFGRDVFVRGGMGHGTHPTIAPVLLWDWGR